MSPLVMVNGCFDVLHPGHVRLLEYAAFWGRLYVAINSDDSVYRLKGPGRPVFTAQERAQMLRALRCVTGVYVFEGDTPADAIATLQPDIIVVGYDHSTEDEHYGQALLRGVHVFKADKYGEYSTSRIVQALLLEKA